MHKQFIQAVRANPECEPITTLRAFSNRILSMWGATERVDYGDRIAGVVEDLVGQYDAAVQGAAPWADLLGPIYTELASPAQISGAGQFFTPPDVADVMVAAQVPTRPEPPAGGGLIRVCDPAVGCGGLLLAFARHVAIHWPERVQYLHLEGGDVVHLAAEFAAIQLKALDRSTGIRQVTRPRSCCASHHHGKSTVPQPPNTTPFMVTLRGCGDRNNCKRQ